MASPSNRAANIIATNRFLTLATADADGPWAAPINYVIGPGHNLHFYSAQKSRHSLAIGDATDVAAAIFNSQASSSDVDGLQLQAHCSLLRGDDLADVYEHYFRVNFAAPEEREWWIRPISAFDVGGMWAFYRLEIQNLWVIDFESMERERLDSRVDVDLAAMWARALVILGC